MKAVLKAFLLLVGVLIVIKLSDVQVGRRVVVDIGNGEDPLIAREIELGVPAPAAKK